MSELPKTFDPAAIEKKWYQHWESTGAFRPHRPDAEPFTIVNPPPNVTGSLHMGHALDNTLQDILVRHARLQGKDALWVVGTDHAGIATQMVVERQLEARQDKRTNYSRDDFVDLVWKWKEESGGTITRQLRRLGCSMDWSREQFTMDPHFSKAVVKVFVDLYNRGLIYRDKRLVNWDPALKTAISDLEVETTEVNGHMWHFKYPLAGGETYTYVEKDADGAIILSEERDYISIATTRPETMLGDGAVAVHPDDERYKPIVGKLCEIPVGPKPHRRLIPIITDDYPDPDFGSGAVKITGAHDQNDYGVAQRNGIPMYRLMDEVAAMRADGPPYAEAAARAKALAGGETASASDIDALNLVPDAYRGLDRYEARKRVVADIDAEGLMVRVEDKVIMQPFGDRSNVVIEPMLTDQWYVDAEKLAVEPLKAVRDGRIDIVPKSWEKTFFHWMENIQPWCVSRQLWWGHRIPAWYDEDGNHYVAATEEDARAQAGGRALKQDEDVLDTWFSSALWPFATLGWPDAIEPSPLQGRGGSGAAAKGEGLSRTPPLPTLSPEGERASLLHRHYPNSVLISGFDILFFWDARMAMMGMEFMGQAPWHTLYLHGLVRAPDGSKMSKSKGNTVDPLILMDQYGADALRFFMAAMESQGRDIKMDERRVEGYRNFATKLWNAARFCQANGIGASRTLAAPPATLAVNKWIIGEVVETLAKLDKAFAEYRFDGMADAIYHFAWGTFCDWYLELVKPVLSNPPRTGEGDHPQDGGGAGAGSATPPTAHETPNGPSTSFAGPPPPMGEDQDAAETRAVAGWVFDQILVMLHPFMPFVTEELWEAMGDRGGNLLIHAKWPEPGAEVDAEAKETVEFAISLISEIRSSRQELNVPPSAQPDILVTERSQAAEAMLFPMWGAVRRMARLGASFTTDVGPFPGQTTLPTVDERVLKSRVAKGAIQIQRPGFTGAILLDGVVDLDSERARISKSIESAAKEAKSLEARLANPAFVEKAKPEAVEKARADHAEKSAEVERLQAALARLG